MQEHQAIYDAIAARDGERAETLLRQHILSVMADQLANLEQDWVSGRLCRTPAMSLSSGRARPAGSARWDWPGSASVTLVEAGPDPGTPPPDWMLYDYLLPDECYYQFTDADNGMALPQGRGTGGGSTVNSAAALRGQPWCYDGWQVPGWSWADVLPGFRAIEADQQFGAAGYHGTGGPIPITRLVPGPLDDALIALCEARGYPPAADHNAPGALGIGVWPTNRRGRAGGVPHAGVLPLVRGTADAPDRYPGGPGWCSTAPGARGPT